MKITPAALQSAMSGDMKNFLSASTPGGIEAQEREGQIEQSFAQTLPADLREYRPMFETLGFKFGQMVDGLFIAAEFPKGWRKKPTDHAMWSEIVDDKDRVRGMIFYKAAFYDRRAHAHLSPRFSVGSDYDKPLETVFIKDACGKVEKRISGLAAPDWTGDRATAMKLADALDEARRELTAWLAAEYPEWESPLAHWE